MAVREFRNRRPRLLAPSRILRPPMRMSGGGREREDLVLDARRMIGEGSQSFATASRKAGSTRRSRFIATTSWAKSSVRWPRSSPTCTP